MGKCAPSAVLGCCCCDVVVVRRVVGSPEVLILTDLRCCFSGGSDPAPGVRARTEAPVWLCLCLESVSKTS